MTSAPSTAQDQPETARLRLLATSDLHMQIQGYDYVTDTPRDTGGLARLAPLIKTARTEALALGAACLLLDNGDTLQGNALADLLARSPDQPHPMIDAFNRLRYDAVGLGNHDFDHGLAYLANAMQGFDMPVLSSNVRCDSLPTLRADALLTRSLRMNTGLDRDLRIGILSVLPPQTAAWNQNHLSGRAEVGDALDALQLAIPQLKDRGADLILVLAHMGIVDDGTDDRQNAALAVSRIPGVDAIIAGHTHVRFPGPDVIRSEEVDPSEGTLNGVPTALPGVAGSDLAVIDLTLNYFEERGWLVSGHRVALRAPALNVREDTQIMRLCAPAHQAARARLAQPVGTLGTGMNTYFAFAAPSPVSALVGMAKRRVIEKRVEGTDLADLPLLASASVTSTGSAPGPDSFIDMKAGKIERRHIAGLTPFANQIWALRVTGEDLVSWLERSARVFTQLHPDRPDQLLADPAVPGFVFDSLYGLTYEIDPTHAPRFDSSGAIIDPDARRIGNLAYQGLPVDPQQEFLVATTHYRAAGGGGFDHGGEAAIAMRCSTMLSDALVDYLKQPDMDEIQTASPWRFAPDLAVSAVLLTAPEALSHLDDIAHLRPEPQGTTAHGFARVRLHL